MFQSGVRASTLPMVFFQLYIREMSSPSTQQPPGKRLNDGLSAFTASARSGRNPPFFQVVFGISETISKNNVPLPDAEICNFAFVSLLEALSSTCSYFQFPATFLMSPDASSFPSTLKSLIVSGPEKLSARNATLNV